MPTGYTEELTKKDVSFEKFVLTCAKAFLGRMKETSGPIPESFKPSGYYENEIRKDQDKLASLRAMSAEQVQAAAEKDYEKAEREYERHVSEVKDCRDRLITMRARVSAWDPPSRDHDGLRKFMLEQLDDTIEHDGQVLGDPPEKKNGKDWKAEKIDYLVEEIAYNEKEQRKEIREVEYDTLWVKRLRDSFEMPRVSIKK